MGAGREECFSREKQHVLEQGFSASTLVALGVRSFLVLVAVLGNWRVLSSIPGP